MRRAFNWFGLTGYGVARVLRNLAFATLFGTAPAYAETVTIAALGDSLTEGYGLPPDDGFVPQMQAWLTAQGADVVLVNAGVSGDTTAGGLSRVDWTLTPDVDAVIVALGGNDFLRGIDPANSRDNLRGIIQVAKAKDVPVLLVGIVAGSNYGPEFKEQFDSIYPDLATEFGAALYPDWFSGLMVDGDVQVARDNYLQGDGIHPNAEGVKLIVDAMGPAVVDLIGQVE